MQRTVLRNRGVSLVEVVIALTVLLLVSLALMQTALPWPYSEIYPTLKEHVAVFDYCRYNLVEPVIKPKNMTLEEVAKELGMAERDFYMHKMNTLEAMSPRKRAFMIKVVHIIATSSYLARSMKGVMPKEIHQMLEKIKA